MSGGGTISLSPALAGSAGIIPARNTGGKLIENGNILLNEGLSSFTPLHLSSNEVTGGTIMITITIIVKKGNIEKKHKVRIKMIGRWLIV